MLGRLVMVSHVSQSLMVSLLARLGMVSHVLPSGVVHVSPSGDGVQRQAVW